MISLVWFKRDLRVADNAALAAACASGRPVIALYVLEPDLWAQPECSGRQLAFLRESLADLDAGLRRRGAALSVRIGDAVEILKTLHGCFGIAEIHAHEETGLFWTYERDRRVRAWARRAGVAFVEHRQHGVWRGPIGRDGWAARWDRLMSAPRIAAPETIRAAPCDAPLADLDAGALGLSHDPCSGRQTGGRVEAARLLTSFLAERAADYRRGMSSPAIAAQVCSRLSAHIALGCVSVREVYQAARRARAQSLAENDARFVGALDAFIARLHWRCHFVQKLEDEPELERRALHPAYEGLRPIGPDHDAIVNAWIEGRTGFPFVDACQRALAASGWLNFRMRAMLMAFSSYHLWQDWRAPARRLAARFTDFEPGVHFSQAQMQSGITGVNAARIYNPVKQGHDQDPCGAFVRTWVPELARLPDAFIHEPWRAPADVLAAAGVSLGRTYPERLVDHVAAGAAARERIYAVRQGEAYRRAADAIQVKHGSRRSGLNASRGPRGRRTQAAASNQAAFDFD